MIFSRAEEYQEASDEELLALGEQLIEKTGLRMRRSPMIRLTAKNVIALHKQMIEKTGGSYGVRDEGLLESALASPFMTYDQIELFPSVYQKLPDCALVL